MPCSAKQAGGHGPVVDVKGHRAAVRMGQTDAVALRQIVLGLLRAFSFAGSSPGCAAPWCWLGLGQVLHPCLNVGVNWTLDVIAQSAVLS